MPRPKSYTKEEFLAAVDGATSTIQISNRLGLTQGGLTNKSLRAYAEELGVVLPDGRQRTRHKTTIVVEYKVSCIICGDVKTEDTRARAERIQREHRRIHES